MTFILLCILTEHNDIELKTVKTSRHQYNLRKHIVREPASISSYFRIINNLFIKNCSSYLRIGQLRIQRNAVCVEDFTLHIDLRSVVLSSSTNLMKESTIVNKYTTAFHDLLNETFSQSVELAQKLYMQKNFYF